MKLFSTWIFVAIMICQILPGPASAHHILGRPSYSLNEDSNTPPAVQVETTVGGYKLTYMVFPDVPKAGRPGRINLYAAAIKDGIPYDGKVTFKARNEDWLAKLGFGVHLETLGVQSPDDAVFRQGVQFGENGDYVVIAEFASGGENHTVEFPLRVGVPSAIGPAVIAVAMVALLLLGLGVLQRRRALTGKIRAAQAKESDE